MLHKLCCDAKYIYKYIYMYVCNKNNCGWYENYCVMRLILRARIF